MPKKTKSKATKKVLFRQKSYLPNTVTNVFREIEVDIPITMDSENLSEKQKRSLIEVAIKSGLISDEWHLDIDLVDDDRIFDIDLAFDEFFLVDEEQITTEIVDVSSVDACNLKKQTEASRLSLNDVKGRSQMEGEQLIGCAGNWELVCNHDGRGVSLHLLSHGCWHGTPKFPVEELTMLKECVDTALLQIKKDALISR